MMKYTITLLSGMIIGMFFIYFDLWNIFGSFGWIGWSVFSYCLIGIIGFIIVFMTTKELNKGKPGNYLFMVFCTCLWPGCVMMLIMAAIDETLGLSDGY